MRTAFSFSLAPNGVGRLVFDLPNEKVNKLSLSVLDELEATLHSLANTPHLSILCIATGKEGVFIAGADLKSFQPLLHNVDLTQEMLNKGHRVFRQLQHLPFPTIAVIHGACLGGGLELALACTYRIVSDHPKTILGLPETTLGIFPGWGGTQRLPKLVGLKEGLSMILSGKPVNAKKAWRIQLADAIIPWEFIEEKTEAFAQQCLTEKGKQNIRDRRKQKRLSSWLLENNLVGRSFFFPQAEKDLLKRTQGRYPAPLAALKLVKETYEMPLEQGLQKEVEHFIQSLSSSDFRYAHALIQLFFTREAIKKDPGVVNPPDKKRSIASVGVVGAGVMGSEIAWLMSYRDLPVRMKDVSWEIVGRGYATAWRIYQTLMRLKKLKPDEANRKFHRLAGGIDYRGFRRLDLVIEAVVESVERKKTILQQLEKEVGADTIIATNTSSLQIHQLAQGMQHPERLIGMHFFNPPSRMPLVEIVPGENTLPEVVAAVAAFCKNIKKTPMVVADCSGFLVNRVFASGFIEVPLMLEEGVEMKKLEKMMLNFGMPMGPLELADHIGNDVNLNVLKTLERSYGKRMQVPSILEAINEKGWLGKKVKKGFYLYEDGKKEPNPEIRTLLGDLGTVMPSFTEEELMDRVLVKMINEAAKCLEEGVVGHAAYLDLALVLGTGFPPYLGGILRYADQWGIHQILEKLKNFCQKYGERFSPADLLIRMDKANEVFYP
ncbi:MAG: 3-hydroxyacyl-CoA dehydrogenase NAD-binding domain-containing protein [Waddliaceae bacterium]